MLWGSNTQNFRWQEGGAWLKKRRRKLPELSSWLMVVAEVVGVVGRAPDSVSESTDSDLGPRLMTRGGEKRSTLSRVRTFLRREKKEKLREEESGGKAGSKTRCTNKT